MYCEFPDFTRCCFCLPLRLGILIFGYLNIIYAILMIALYSYSVHVNAGVDLVYHGVVAEAAEEVCIAFYILEILINIGLIYGSHRQQLPFIRVFYYYALATTTAALVIAVVDVSSSRPTFLNIEMISFALCGLCLQGYLIALVRSLIKKLSLPPQQYDNTLNTIISGEFKNEVYDSSSVVAA